MNAGANRSKRKKRPRSNERRRASTRARSAGKKPRRKRGASRKPAAPSSAPAKTARRWLWWVLGGLAAFVAIGGLSLVWLYRAWRISEPEAPRAFVAVSWPEGLDARDAAELLHDFELTDSRRAMELFLRLHDGPGCFVPGPHLLRAGAKPLELLGALCREDDRAKVKVTFPEGFHRYAIAARLEKAGVVSEAAFLRASGDPLLLHRLAVDEAEHRIGDTAEGYLFPATYEFHLDSEAEAVVARMVGETKRRFARLSERHPGGWERLQSELSFGRREALTLASLVEKEAGIADERPIIASVFLNRLRDPEFPHLQSDPTAVYGCLVMPEQIAACADFEGKASGQINRDPHNIYSTYVTRGLPPGPIANPGEASIEAVLAPADTPYRFFVAKGKGRHDFSETLAEHDEAVNRLRDMRR